MFEKYTYDLSTPTCHSQYPGDGVWQPAYDLASAGLRSYAWAIYFWEGELLKSKSKHV